MNAVLKNLEDVLKEVPAVIGQNECLVPCNEHAFSMLSRLKAAVLCLDDMRCVVARIELGNGTPTITLQQAPRPGAIPGAAEFMTLEGGGKRRIQRAFWRGCTVEWNAL